MDSPLIVREGHTWDKNTSAGFWAKNAGGGGGVNRAANPKSYKSDLSDLLSASLHVATISCVNLLHTCYMHRHRHRLQKEVLFDEGGEGSKYCIILQIEISQWLAILVCVFCSVCVVSQKPNSHSQSTCIHYIVVNTVIHKFPLFKHFCHT